MTSPIHSPVTELLQQENILYDVIEIPLTEDRKPIRNLEELLTKRGIDPQSVVRSVLFKTASDQFVLLAVAGGGRADWGVLRKHLNERKCRMAEYDEVPEATGYVVGAVPPVALPESIKILVDDSVRGYETVVIGSGVLGVAEGRRSAAAARWGGPGGVHERRRVKRQSGCRMQGIAGVAGRGLSLG